MISRTEIQKHLRYDSGKLFWISSGKKRVVGARAGNLSSIGYLRITILGVSYYEHHLVWILFGGDLVSGFDIDHINGDRADNRIENLRRISRAENLRNRRTPNSTNASGLLGVHFHRHTGVYSSKVRTSEGSITLCRSRNKWEVYHAYLTYREKKLPNDPWILQQIELCNQNK